MRSPVDVTRNGTECPVGHFDCPKPPFRGQLRGPIESADVLRVVTSAHRLKAATAMRSYPGAKPPSQVIIAGPMPPKTVTPIL